MTTNRRLQFLSGRNIYSPINDFWMLGNLTAMDPEIPNLPLEATAETVQTPYAKRVSTSVIVDSWTVAALPQQRQNKQIVDNTPVVTNDDPPRRSPYSLSFIPSLWVSTAPNVQPQKAKTPQVVTDRPRPLAMNAIIASWYFTFALPQARRKLPIIAALPPKSKANFNIIASAWVVPVALPPTPAKVVSLISQTVLKGRDFQIYGVPNLWTVSYYDQSTRKSIAVFTPNIPPVVIPGTPAGGYMPYTETATLGWGAIRAYPQVIFDVAYEQAPRGVLAPVEKPVIAAMPVSDKEKLARYAAAAAAFDLDLVRKYLEAVGIDLDA